MLYLFDPAITWQIRHACIKSVTTLYRDCFARRCRLETTHMKDVGLRSMNGVCFMWWDRFPSSGVGTTTDAERETVDRAMMNVMAETLELEHDACRESALHGLGHLGFVDEAWVHSVVDDWLVRHPNLPKSLVEYAIAARDGQVP